MASVAFQMQWKIGLHRKLNNMFVMMSQIWECV